MRNYYLQLNDLVIAETRLSTLKNKLKRLEDNIYSCTSSVKEVLVAGGIASDKFDKYIIEKEEILQEIKDKEEEIELIKKNLHIMEMALRNMKNTQEEIFVMYHIEGLKPKQIARKLPCDLSTVYSYLRKINKELISPQKKPKKM